MSRATEECSCGGTFTYDGDDVIIAAAFRQWRRDHQHEISEAPPVQDEVRAVTGSHHQAGPVRPGPIGRRHAIGFQLHPPTPEKENT